VEGSPTLSIQKIVRHKELSVHPGAVKSFSSTLLIYIGKFRKIYTIWFNGKMRARLWKIFCNSSIIILLMPITPAARPKVFAARWYVALPHAFPEKEAH
jgi:hypothetical protein